MADLNVLIDRITRHKLTTLTPSTGFVATNQIIVSQNEIVDTVIDLANLVLDLAERIKVIEETHYGDDSSL